MYILGVLFLLMHRDPGNLFQEVIRFHNPQEGINGGVSVRVDTVFVDLLFERGAQIFQNDRMEIVADSVKGRCEDAEMGIDTPYCDGIDTQSSQCLV